MCGDLVDIFTSHAYTEYPLCALCMHAAYAREAPCTSHCFMYLTHAVGYVCTFFSHLNTHFHYSSCKHRNDLHNSGEECVGIWSTFLRHTRTLCTRTPGRINPTREGVGICTEKKWHNSTVKVNQERKGILSFMCLTHYAWLRMHIYLHYVHSLTLHLM